MWTILLFVLISNSLWAQEGLLKDLSDVLIFQNTNEEMREAGEAIQREIDDTCFASSVGSEFSDYELSEFRSSLVSNQIDFRFKVLNKNEEGKVESQSIDLPVINLRDEITYLSVKYSKPRDSFFQLGKDELLSLIEKNYLHIPKDKREKLIRDAYLVFEISNLKSEEEIVAKISSELMNEDFSSKINFVTNLLSYVPKYSVDDFGEKDVSSIQVKEQLHSSIMENKKLSFHSIESLNQLAIKLSRQLGLENTFGLKFASFGFGSVQTIYFKNPDNPNQYIQLAYDMPRFHKKKLIQYVDEPLSGGLGVILSDGVQSARTTASESSPSRSVFVSLPEKAISKKETSVLIPQNTSSLFFTEIPSSTKLKTSGGKLNLKLSLDDTFYTELGFSGFSSVRPVDNSLSFDESVSGRFSSGFNVDFIKDDDILLSSYGDATLSTDRNCSKTESEICGGDNTDEKLRSSAGLKLIFGGPALKLKTIYSSGFTLDLEDPAEMRKDSLLNPVHRITTDTDFKVVSSLRGVFGVGVTRQTRDSEIDWRYSGKLGINSQLSGTYFEVSADGMLSSDTPYWYPLDQNQASVILKQSIFDKRFVLGVTGRSSLDDPEKEKYIGIFIGGTGP